MSKCDEQRDPLDVGWPTWTQPQEVRCSHGNDANCPRCREISGDIDRLWKPPGPEAAITTSSPTVSRNLVQPVGWKHVAQLFAVWVVLPLIITVPWLVGVFQIVRFIVE